MLKKYKILIILFTALITLGVGSFVFAQEGLGLNYASNIGLSTPDESDLRVVLVNIVRYFLGFVGIIAVAVILYAGFLWMTSAGRPDQLIKAKRTLLNGVVGLIITLAAFAIVTFIVNLFDGGGGGLGRGGRPGNGPGGFGALGACAVESVYPAPGQEDVPRNTSIIVTFKKDITATDIMDAGNNLVPENVHIYQSQQGDSCEWDVNQYINCTNTNLTNVNVSQSGRTFVFTPNVLMGTANGNTGYSVRLDQAIRDTDGDSIFADCRTDSLVWSFKVSNRLDLVPPIVENEGITPVPDNDVDTVVPTAAVAAEGAITVLDQPQVGTNAEYVSYTKLAAPMPDLVVTINSNNTFDGNLRVTIQGIGEIAGLSDINNLANIILLGSFEFGGGTTINIPGYFTIEASEDVEVGDQWDITVIGRKSADTLTVGPTTYYFVNAGAGVGEINLGIDTDGTAQNIYNTINADALQVVDASNLVDLSFDLTATEAGASGNSIELRTNNSSKFSFTPMNGGANAYTNLQPVGMPDPPRNILIQLDFNEAINPATVSGDSALVSDKIQVRCLSGSCADGTFACGPNTCVNGRFEISNQYRTLEFIPSVECGVNSCGEAVYCLPSNSNIEVWLHAASLDPCTGNPDCISRQSFNTCSDIGGGQHCNNGTTYYPLSNLGVMDGVMDTANNSLDGNRNTDADGPVSDYNENPGAQDPLTGDNYVWSFWVSDMVDTTPPVITGIVPTNGSRTNVSLEDPLEVVFSKPMQSSSLRTGQSKDQIGGNLITHKHINLWNYANRATGYWITNEDLRDANGFPISTTAYINHSVLGPLLTYRTQVGSGVRDIYQNCYRPAEGPDCAGAYNSCCDGTGVAGETCP
jgi:hypothetical protein